MWPPPALWLFERNPPLEPPACIPPRVATTGPVVVWEGGGWGELQSSPREGGRHGRQDRVETCETDEKMWPRVRGATWYGLQSSFQSPGISGRASVPASWPRLPLSAWTDSLDTALTSREAWGNADLPSWSWGEECNSLF